jgi:hypothetical protein
MHSRQEARHWDGARGKAKDLDFSAAGDGTQVRVQDRSFAASNWSASHSAWMWRHSAGARQGLHDHEHVCLPRRFLASTLGESGLLPLPWPPRAGCVRMQEAGSAPLKPLNLGRSLVDADAEDSDDDSEVRRPAQGEYRSLYCPRPCRLQRALAVYCSRGFDSRSQPPAGPAAAPLQQRPCRLAAPHSHPGGSGRQWQRLLPASNEPHAAAAAAEQCASSCRCAALLRRTPLHRVRLLPAG